MDPRIRSLTLRTALRSLADFALPRTCVVCGRSLIAAEDVICIPCLGDMPLTHFEQMSHNPMADRFNALIEARRYAYAVALFHYRDGSGYDHITQALKYDGDFAAGRLFASMLGERLAGAAEFSDVDAVVPVPLHWTRRWRRGYNQAEVIAGELASALGVPVMTDMLRRKRRTSSQARVSGHAAKAFNVAGAFSVTVGSAVGLKHILLVDDVFTTGSTLAECQRVLYASLGADVRISVATLAFVGGD